MHAGAHYRVLVTLAADDASAGDRFVIATERTHVGAVVQSSGGYDAFREDECGTIELMSGLNRVVMRPDGPARACRRRDVTGRSLGHRHPAGQSRRI